MAFPSTHIRVPNVSRAHSWHVKVLSSTIELDARGAAGRGIFGKAFSGSKDRPFRPCFVSRYGQDRKCPVPVSVISRMSGICSYPDQSTRPSVLSTALASHAQALIYSCAYFSRPVLTDKFDASTPHASGRHYAEIGKSSTESTSCRSCHSLLLLLSA